MMFEHVAGFGVSGASAWTKWSASEFEEVLDSQPDVEKLPAILQGLNTQTP